MSIYIGKVWECENCGEWVRDKPWKCPVCDKEVCETCFDRYMLCEDCAEGKTDEECEEIVYKKGYDQFRCCI